MNNKKINILSLFDGMACTRIVFDKLGYKPDEINYYSSEIDKYANKVSKGNYPEIHQIGDVTKVQFKKNTLITENEDFKKIGKIDLLIGGSPCFVKGSQVLTKEGYKNICDIKVGDYVMTHKMRYRKVLAIGGNQNKDILSIKAQGLFWIDTTEDHPFYIRKMNIIKEKSEKFGYKSFAEPEWLEAKEITKGCYLGIPIIKEEEKSF